ncbi:hypothetical protein [Streptomyces sp. NPDC018947]|uniref:hypothetical protein n=1 Tax=Streptomyces sp. NPDC018947 TaxID=3365054 RepID=UPI003794E791
MALVEDATRRLADRGIDHPTDHMLGLIRSRASVTGLYDDGVLVGCLAVHPEPDLRHWNGDCPSLGVLVSVAPPMPGHNDQTARLLTLWLADRAAQHGLEWVWWEVPCATDLTRATLLDFLRDLGWEDLPAVRRADGERVIPLRLRAEKRPALTAAVSASADALPLLAVSTR